MIEFKCHHCGYEQEVPPKAAGRKAKCPKCGEFSRILTESDATDEQSDPEISTESEEIETPESFFADVSGNEIELDDLEDDNAEESLEQPPKSTKPMFSNEFQQRHLGRVREGLFVVSLSAYYLIFVALLVGGLYIIRGISDLSGSGILEPGSEFVAYWSIGTGIGIIAAPVQVWLVTGWMYSLMPEKAAPLPESYSQQR